MDELTSRAMAAYFRSEGAAADQPADVHGLMEWDGKSYVVLRNVRGILAVYRVRTSGALKRLRRWPAGIERY
jgi:hypothetical protein